MISSHITRKADVVSAVIVLSDDKISETVDLGVHGNLNVYLYVSDKNTVTQLELDMDKYHAFGFADEVLDALKGSGVDFDRAALTKSDLTQVIAQMRARV